MSQRAKADPKDEYSDEPVIPLANYYECERCSDIREALEELGYCIQVGSNILDDLRDYQEEQNLKKIFPIP